MHPLFIRPMMHDISTLNRTKNGQLVKCDCCGKYQLHFNNLFFEFTEGEYERFCLDLLNMELGYWENCHQNCEMTRKIPLPTSQNNLVLLFTRRELYELRDLVNSNKGEDKFLNAAQVDYKFALN